MCRSFALLFRISDQGNQLAREARKVTQLTGRAASETHRGLNRAVMALRAFSRRRAGRPAMLADTVGNSNGRTVLVGGPSERLATQSPPPPPTTTKPLPRKGTGESGAPVKVTLTAAARGGEDGTDASPPDEAGADVARTRSLSAIFAAAPPRLAPAPSAQDAPAAAVSLSAAPTGLGTDLISALQAPLLASSPLNRPLSTDSISSAEEEPNAGGNAEDGTAANSVGVRSNSSSSSSGSSINDGSPLIEAWAAAAAEEAAAKSAALKASVAAEDAAQVEEKSVSEALGEVRRVLKAGREDADGAQAEVERVAAGVGLPAALLGALRALRREDDAGAGAGGSGGSNWLSLAKEVLQFSWCRRSTNVSLTPLNVQGRNSIE